MHRLRLETINPLQIQLGRWRFSNVIGNAIGLGLGGYAAGALTLLLSLTIARSAGAADFGAYGLAISATGLALTALNSGFSNLMKRDLARAPGDISVYFATVLVTRLASFVPAAVVVTMLTVGTWTSQPSTALILAVVFLIKALESLLEMCFAIYQSQQRMSFQYLLEPTRLAAVVLLTLLIGAGLTGILWCFLILTMLFTALHFAILRRAFGVRSAGVSRDLLRYFLKEGWPLGASAVMLGFYSREEIIILSWFSDQAVIGNYAAMLQVLAGLTMVPAAIGTALYPTFARSWRQAPREYAASVKRSIKMIVALGALAAISLVLLRVPISRLYGAEFSELDKALLLLAPSLVPIFGEFLTGYALVCMDRPRTAFFIVGVATVVKGSLVFILAPNFGLEGTLLAVFIAHSLSLSLGWFFLSTDTSLIEGSSGPRPRALETAQS